MHPDIKAQIIDGLYSLANEIWRDIGSLDPTLKADALKGFDWVRTKLAELESVPTTPTAQG